MMSENSQHKHLDEKVTSRDDWARRRRKNIPTNKHLMVVTCMDERIPVEDALELELGDAHIFRNAGGKVTDDVIRSAALSTNFFGTEEIIVLNHTDCGMMKAPPEDIVKGLEEATEGRLDDIPLNPALKELNLGASSLEEWLYMTEDIDKACEEQVNLLRDHPLIPEHVTITGYIYEVESDSIRRPGERIAEEISRRTS